MSTVAVVDYGMGNRRSVEKALEHVGAQVRVTGDHEAIREADAVVVPGVGAFPEAMRRLNAAGLDGVIRERAGQGTPVLGICLGMQLLFERLGRARGRRRASACSRARSRRSSAPKLPAHRLEPRGARAAVDA